MNKNKTYIVVFLIFAFILGLVTFGEQMFHSTMAMFRSDQKEEVVYEDELIKNRKIKSENKKKEFESKKGNDISNNEEIPVAETYIEEPLIESKVKKENDEEKRVSNSFNNVNKKEGKDSDYDGVLDHNDECPYVSGVSNLFGCPDSDGDGVGDSRDKCPFDKGLFSNSGCP